MKVKCKICGLVGFFDTSRVGEFWASRFLLIHVPIKKGIINPANTKFICRRCSNAILDALRSESYRIDDLYKPEVKEKKG